MATTPEQKAADKAAKDAKKIADKAAKDGSVKPSTDGGAVGFGGAGQPADPTAEDKKIDFPEGHINPKFYSIPFRHGYVVYNQYGQRATGIVSDAIAKDLVLKNNIAAGLK